MNTHLILWAIVIASVFYGWPVVAKWSGIVPLFATLVIYGTGSMLLSLITVLKTPQLTAPVPPLKFYGFVTIALANCLCVFVYTKITSDKEVPTGIFMVAVAMFGVLFSLLFDYLLNSATINKGQIFGGLLAIASIWFVNQK